MTPFPQAAGSQNWLFLIFFFVFFGSIPTRAAVSNIEWIRQAGSANEDNGIDVAVDNFDDVYLLSNRRVSVGPPGGDFFVTKYNSAGVLQWTQQVGTDQTDNGFGISADPFGNLYVTGTTQGPLGGPKIGGVDAFLTKIGANGSVQWSRQFGSVDVDFAFDVSTDATGNAFIVGDTTGALTGGNLGSSDAFVAKYDPNGNLLWTRQFGTSDAESAFAVGNDPNGNVYVTGETRGDLGGSNAGNSDAFLVKFDTNGNQLWAEQFGTGQKDLAEGLAVDMLGNVYLSGETRGTLATDPFNGEIDAFATKFDAAGNNLWLRQWGTNLTEEGQSIAIDAAGGVVVGGYTTGNLAPTAVGGTDAYLTRINSDGTVLWTEQFGSTSRDFGTGVATDSQGYAYLSGTTEGALDGANMGDSDAFVAKFFVIPEPTSTTLLLASGALGILLRHRSGRQSAYGRRRSQ